MTAISIRLRQLADLVDAGTLPTWVVTQITSAIGPVSRIVASLPERIPGPRPPWRGTGVRCDDCGIWSEDATAALHHSLRSHTTRRPARLAVIEGGKRA